jgi:glycopeptide antibiotics resistance protein
MGTRADWVANILLFIPLTFFWMGALANRRGGRARTAVAILIVPVAAFAAVALEFTQIWFVGRTVSRNDIVAETIGGMLGVALWLGVGERLIAWLATYSADHRPQSQMRWFLQAYLLGFLVYSVIPLDLTISVADLYDKYKRGQMILVPFSYHYGSLYLAAYDILGDVVVFVPVGAWVVLTAREHGRSRSPVLVGISGGCLIAAAIEFVQLIVVSRFTDVTDIITGTVGAGIGAWIVTRADVRMAMTAADGESRPRAKIALLWLALLAGYSLFLVAGFWYPFEFTHDRTIIRVRLDDFLSRVPFLALYLGTEFNAITQLLIRLLLFAPVGAIWAYIASLARTPAARHFLLLVGFLYATVLAFGIEIVEVLMPAKIADSTEVVLCMAGALAGLIVTSRLVEAGRKPPGASPPR